jgi:hypothetical protein
MQYESLEEGIEATINIYISILLDLIHTKGLELFIHPVPPVLNETRRIVKPFVAALKRAVRKAPDGGMQGACNPDLLLCFLGTVCFQLQQADKSHVLR